MKNKKTLRVVLFVAIVVAISIVVTVVNLGNARNMTLYNLGYAAGAMARHSFIIVIIMYWMSIAIQKYRQKGAGMFR